MGVLIRRLPQRLKRPLLLAVLLAFAAEVQAAGVLIVANTAERDLKLTRIEVRNLFMGEVSNLALEAIALPPDNLTRMLFNTRIIGLTEARIQAYWAKMRFSGRKQPPGEFWNEAAALLCWRMKARSGISRRTRPCRKG